MFLLNRHDRVPLRDRVASSSANPPQFTIIMTYKWDDWRDTCHRLDVLEKKSIDEIIKYCQQRDFTPRYVVIYLAVR
jgi:hypothetical protein